MQISSDSLFHFTDKIDVIKEILLDKFKGSYCKEILRYNEEITSLYIPMISFCDMPLKTYCNLDAIYGRFGIAMTKDWGIKHKLNPVLYIEKNSRLLETGITQGKNLVN